MRSRRWGAAALAGVVCAACGCQRATVEHPAIQQYPAATQELDYLDALNGQVVVTNDDAMHGLILFADGSDLSTDYAGRVKVAKEKGWVSEGWDRPANESATVGWMAVAGCKITGIEGGLSMRLFGPTPRYATRELIYQGVLPLRTDNQSLSGAEFVDYLNRLGRIQRYGKAVALQPVAVQEGVGVQPAGAPDQLLNESAVEMALPVVVPRTIPGAPPAPASEP